MAVYFALMLALMGLGLIAREAWYSKGIDIRRGALAASCLLLFVIAACRANSVGADTANYQWIFHWIGSLPINHVLEASGSYYLMQGIEPGYKLYNWLLYQIFPFGQAITIANSALLIGFLYRAFKLNSKDEWLSVFAFLTLGLFQSSLNLMPSAIATAFMMSFCYCIEQKRPVRFILAACFAAIFFHMSAIVFIPIYFILQITLTKRLFAVLLIVGLSLSTLTTTVFSGLLSAILPDSYRAYVASSSSNPEQLLVGLLLVFLVAICGYVVRERNWMFKRKNNVANWFLLFTIVCFSFAYFNTSFARLSLIFTMFFTLFLPLYISGISSSISRSGFFLSSYDRAGVFLAVTLACAYVARMSINNIGSTIPYAFCF